MCGLPFLDSELENPERIGFVVCPDLTRICEVGKVCVCCIDHVQLRGIALTRRELLELCGCDGNESQRIDFRGFISGEFHQAQERSIYMSGSDSCMGVYLCIANHCVWFH